MPKPIRQTHRMRHRVLHWTLRETEAREEKALWPAVANKPNPAHTQLLRLSSPPSVGRVPHQPSSLVLPEKSSLSPRLAKEEVPGPSCSLNLRVELRCSSPAQDLRSTVLKRQPKPLLPQSLPSATRVPSQPGHPWRKPSQLQGNMDKFNRCPESGAWVWGSLRSLFCDRNTTRCTVCVFVCGGGWLIKALLRKLSPLKGLKSRALLHLQHPWSPSPQALDYL